MERRINTKIETYIGDLKTKICEKINEKTSILANEDRSELLQYVYDFERLMLVKDDFIKRKRIKNAIPVTNRCNALRANNEQCTRRRKDGCEYCGTHSKGTPHGAVHADGEQDITDTTKTLDVFAKEIMGIVYYIDHNKNVYNTEDIMNSVENPRIIAKYINNGGNITIPDFGLV
tara:strand:+ start:532 stop:1056 length:525 start_codon:yes stop_codon:yes gene_type:complete